MTATATIRPLLDRDKTLGRLSWMRGVNGEVKVLPRYAETNLKRITVPQLISIPGASKNGIVYCHRLLEGPIRDFFAACEKADRLGLVKTWDGCYNPRFIRGSTTQLSMHAYGAAFDINAAWNPLGKEPPAIHEEGSVRQLVPIAESCGLYWGGYFERRDGMHFELGEPWG